MAKPNRLQTITAQHVERTDKKGTPLTKSFTQKAWNDIPTTDYMTNEGRIKRAKQGWVQVGQTTGAKAPEPLAKTPPVQPQRPVAPRAPRIEDEGVKVG